MPHVVVDALVAADVDEVFALSQDYAARLSWDPFLRALDGPAPALGARVWVKARNGLQMTVEYVTYRPPEVVGVKMVDGPSVFRTFGATWRFAAEGRGQTRVTFQYSFTLKRWTCPPISHAIAAMVFRRDMRTRIEALKRHVEQ